MNFILRTVIFLIGLLLFWAVIELIKRRRLREELSLVWLITGLGLMVSSVADYIIDPLALSLGISYPPVLVFLIIFFLIVLVILYFSIVVSDLKSKNKELSQKIALLEFRVRRDARGEDTSRRPS
ncbi:MAG TPA: DUF2304 domain-containing protein [Dissulfurispiraceae bacterium]|jgi:FtsH-binding integral membrane protein|nr:DUF2304 domain-containing protein [Dissulfurispiraceae bacterium]